MESKIIVKILGDKSWVFQKNLLESRHLLICLPEIAAGKLRDLGGWPGKILVAGQQRNLWAGQLRDLEAGQPRDLGAGQPRDLETGQPRDLEADKHRIMI